MGGRRQPRLRSSSMSCSRIRLAPRTPERSTLALRLLQNNLQMNELSFVAEYQGNLPEVHQVHLDGTRRWNATPAGAP